MSPYAVSPGASSPPTKSAPVPYGPGFWRHLGKRAQDGRKRCPTGYRVSLPASRASRSQRRLGQPIRPSCCFRTSGFLHSPRPSKGAAGLCPTGQGFGDTWANGSRMAKKGVPQGTGPHAPRSQARRERQRASPSLPAGKSRRQEHACLRRRSQGLPTFRQLHSAAGKEPSIGLPCGAPRWDLGVNPQQCRTRDVRKSLRGSASDLRMYTSPPYHASVSSCAFFGSRLPGKASVAYDCIQACGASLVQCDTMLRGRRLVSQVVV